MLTEKLRHVVEQLEQLAPDRQDALASSIQADLDQDLRWEAAMNDPHDLVLDRLIAEARAQVARGEVRDLDETR